MFPRCIFLFLILFGSGCDSNNKIFKLNPGDNQSYNYSIIKSSSQEWNYENKYHQSSDTVYMDIGLQELESSGDTILFKMIFNKLNVIPHPLKMNLLNSDAKISQFNPFIILDSICRSLKGQYVEVAITGEGNVLQVKGLERLYASIAKDSRLEIKNIMRQLQDHVSENSIKDLLNIMLSIPDGKKIKVADSWVKNLILITKAPIKLSNMYTLEKISGDSVEIKINSIVSNPTTVKGDEVFLNGKQEGHAILSYSSGLPYEYKTTLETITKTSSYDVIIKQELSVILK